MSPTQITQARAMIEAGPYTKKQIADTFNVSRATLYRQLERWTPLPQHELLRGGGAGLVISGSTDEPVNNGDDTVRNGDG